MAWDTAFEDLMPATVTIQTITGVSTDGYGTPTWSTAKSKAARVVEKQTLVRTFEGTEELATTVVWLRSTSTFGPSDRITLPDGTSPHLMAVEELSDEDGYHHTKVFMG